MGQRRKGDTYRTSRHVFVRLDKTLNITLRKMTGFSQAKVFHAILDTIPGPVERHKWHLLHLAYSLGIYKPYIGLWKGMSALILPGNTKLALAKQKGVKTMTSDELDEVMLSYHSHKMGVASADHWV